MASVVARLRPMIGRSVFAPSPGVAGTSKLAMMHPMTSFSSMRMNVLASAKTAYVSETKVRYHSVISICCTQALLLFGLIVAIDLD